MASAKKRTRRSAAATKTPRAATVRTASPPATTVPTTPKTATPPPTRASTAEASAPGDGARPSSRRDAVDWSNEYSYVIGDLKQMAVISAGLFAVMIIIGYFL